MSFEGRFYHIREADIGPKPVRPGGPNYWNSGASAS